MERIITDKKKLREILWHSLDMQVVKLWFWCAVILGVFGTLLGFWKLNGLDMAHRILGIALTTGILVLPFLIFCLWRTVKIFRHMEDYTFCKTNLCNPRGGNIRNTIRFVVLLEDRDGAKFSAMTHSIFFTGGFLGSTLEHYVNSTVTAAYNEETGTVVIIG